MLNKKLFGMGILFSLVVMLVLFLVPIVNAQNGEVICTGEEFPPIDPDDFHNELEGDIWDLIFNTISYWFHDVTENPGEFTGLGVRVGINTAVPVPLGGLIVDGGDAAGDAMGGYWRNDSNNVFGQVISFAGWLICSPTYFVYSIREGASGGVASGINYWFYPCARGNHPIPEDVISALADRGIKTPFGATDDIVNEEYCSEFSKCPYDDQACRPDGGNCNCKPSTCGNGRNDVGETCDPPGSACVTTENTLGSCNDKCTCDAVVITPIDPNTIKPVGPDTNIDVIATTKSRYECGNKEYASSLGINVQGFNPRLNYCTNNKDYCKQLGKICDPISCGCVDVASTGSGDVVTRPKDIPKPTSNTGTVAVPKYHTCGEPGFTSGMTCNPPGICTSDGVTCDINSCKCIPDEGYTGVVTPTPKPKDEPKPTPVVPDTIIPKYHTCGEPGFTSGMTCNPPGICTGVGIKCDINSCSCIPDESYTGVHPETPPSDGPDINLGGSSTGTTSTPKPTCGNGIVEGNEECERHGHCYMGHCASDCTCQPGVVTDDSVYGVTPTLPPTPPLKEVPTWVYTGNFCGTPHQQCSGVGSTECPNGQYCTSNCRCVDKLPYPCGGDDGVSHTDYGVFDGNFMICMERYCIGTDVCWTNDCTCHPIGTAGGTITPGSGGPNTGVRPGPGPGTGGGENAYCQTSGPPHDASGNDINNFNSDDYTCVPNMNCPGDKDCIMTTCKCPTVGDPPVSHGIIGGGENSNNIGVGGRGEESNDGSGNNYYRPEDDEYFNVFDKDTGEVASNAWSDAMDAIWNFFNF